MRNPIKLAAGLLAAAMLLTFAAFAEEAPAAENYEAYAGAWYAADDPWDGRFYVTIESVEDGRMTWSFSDVFFNATLYQTFEDTELTDGAASFHAEGEALNDENQVFSYDGAIALKDGAVALTLTAGELEERSPEGGSSSHHVEAIDEANRTFVLSRRGEAPAGAVERFSDTWVDDGAAVEIWYEGGTFHCRGVLGDGGDESNVFEYTFAEYDAAGDALVCEDGTRTYEKRNAGGELESDMVVTDLTAAFTLDDQDRLIWNDSEGICKRFALRRLDVAEGDGGDAEG